MTYITATKCNCSAKDLQVYITMKFVLLLAPLTPVKASYAGKISDSNVYIGTPIKPNVLL